MRLVRRLGIVFLLLIAFSVVYGAMTSGEPEIEPGSTLVVRMNGRYVESAAPPVMARLLGSQVRPFVALLSQLTLAERDDRIAAVVLHITGLDIGWAKAQELRAAIGRLRAAGRHTVAYLEMQSIAAHRDYFVAVAAEEIQIVPGGSVPLVGLSAEYFYLGGMFAKLGIEFEVAKAGRYKSAVEVIAGTGMSEASREMANSLLDSVDRQFIDAIAEGRGLAHDEVRRCIDGGPVLASELISLGLADGSVHLDELLTGLGGEVVHGRDYAAVDPKSVGFKPEATYALIYGTGNVITGDSVTNSRGDPVFAAGAFARALEDAAEADEVEAIIVRIDSPGGSAIASELMWRAIHKTRVEHDKPIIASFSDVAASGGYYVASAADAIVASGTSVTGSIGVFALRPILKGLLDEFGIEAELLMRGQHADLASASLTGPPSDGARERLQRLVLNIYDQFLERVANGRELETAEVDRIAQGRVWTGAQARERGLVDELGGLREAVVRAKIAQGLEPDADVLLVTYPPPRSLVEQLSDLLDARIARVTRLQLHIPEPLVRLERFAASLPVRTPLLVPPVLVEIR